MKTLDEGYLVIVRENGRMIHPHDRSFYHSLAQAKMAKEYETKWQKKECYIAKVKLLEMEELKDA